MAFLCIKRANLSLTEPSPKFRLGQPPKFARLITSVRLYWNSQRSSPPHTRPVVAHPACTKGDIEGFVTFLLSAHVGLKLIKIAIRARTEHDTAGLVLACNCSMGHRQRIIRRVESLLRSSHQLRSGLRFYDKLRAAASSWPLFVRPAIFGHERRRSAIM